MRPWTEAEQEAHRQAWVEALRSGNYLQTTGALIGRDWSAGITPPPIAYCCLGVACVVAAEDPELAPFELEIDLDDEVVRFGIGYGDETDSEAEADNESEYLPPFLVDYFGLLGTRGEYGESDDEELIRLNDDGVTFGDIARTIESEEFRVTGTQRGGK